MSYVSKWSDSEPNLVYVTAPRSRTPVHVHLLWSTVSLVVTAGSVFSFVQPYWFTQRETSNSLGLYNYCVRDPTSSQELRHRHTAGASESKELRQLCGVYGGAFDLAKLPSNSWQVSCVLYGGGCLLLACGALASVATLCMPARWSHRLSSYTGYIQSIAAVILILAVALFPVGLDSKFAQHYCPGASMYRGGSCQVGWAYILGIMSAALSVFCPFLSQYTDFSEDNLASKLIP